MINSFDEDFREIIKNILRNVDLNQLCLEDCFDKVASNNPLKVCKEGIYLDENFQIVLATLGPKPGKVTLSDIANSCYKSNWIEGDVFYVHCFIEL